MEVNGFECVNLRLRLRELLAELRGHFARPGEALFIRHAIAEFQFALGHLQRRRLLPLDPVHQVRDALSHLLCVGVVTDLAPGRAVIHPHQVAARALRHDADERVIRPEHRRNVARKATVVIRRKQRGLVIVHRVIREERERLAIGALHREHGELRIDRTAGADGVGAFVAGMHVRAHVALAERVRKHFVRTTNPAAVEGVLPVIHLRPADTRRHQALDRTDDRRRDSPRQKRRVSGVHAAAQTSHRRWRGMSVRGGDQHSFRGNSGGLAGVGLRTVDEIARHHARIDDAQHESRRAVIQRERLREERINDLVRRTLGEHGVHADGKSGGRDVHRVGTGPEGRRGGESERRKT